MPLYPYHVGVLEPGTRIQCGWAPSPPATLMPPTPPTSPASSLTPLTPLLAQHPHPVQAYSFHM